MAEQQGTPAPVKKVTLDEMKVMIADIVKTSTAEQIAALKTELKGTMRKAVFPHEDGAGVAATGDGDCSVIDYKSMRRAYRGNDGPSFAKSVCASGGPFKRLGPEMRIFAQMIKCRFDHNAYAAAGVDVKAYNERCLAQYKAAGLSEGVAADGGNLVPVEYAATLIEFATQQSPILSQVWQMPMSSNVLRIPRLVQAAGSYFGGITIYWTDEAAQKTTTKPAFEQLVFTARKLVGLVYLTDELIADSMINIVNYVTGLFTRAFQYEMERVIVNGTGAAAGQPLGIVNDPAVNIVARATAGTVGYMDVMNLDAAIDENFRDLTWLSRKATTITLKSLRDNNNRPIFLEGYTAFNSEPTWARTMFGYPAILTRNVPALGSQGDLILGDLGMYMLAIRQDLRIDTSIHSRFEYDETGVRFVARLDGQPAVPIAFAILNDAAS